MREEWEIRGRAERADEEADHAGIAGGVQEVVSPLEELVRANALEAGRFGVWIVRVYLKKNVSTKSKMNLVGPK